MICALLFAGGGASFRCEGASCNNNTFSFSLGYRAMQETLNQTFVFRGASVVADYAYCITTA